MVKIVNVQSDEHMQHIRSLFREYEQSLGFTLDFQDFEKELARLPGEYAAPHGRLFLALEDGQVAGCVALRRFRTHVCEMKRLYVRPDFRGEGIGRALAVRLIKEAREIGYRCMRLDTIATMHEAIALYLSLGFREIGSYRFNPLPDARYMELTL